MPEPNVYGVDVAMGPSGDLVVNTAGSLVAIGDFEVCAQALLLRLRTGLGDLLLHPSYGIDLPIGSKMDEASIASTVNGTLQDITKNDPRFQRATVVGLQPLPNEPTGIQVEVEVVLVGGVTLKVQGLPSEARVAEVSTTGSESGESDLNPPEEEEFFSGEGSAGETNALNQINSIVEGTS